jgi:hypothetical protein
MQRKILDLRGNRHKANQSVGDFPRRCRIPPLLETTKMENDKEKKQQGRVLLPSHVVPERYVRSAIRATMVLSQWWRNSRSHRKPAE